MRAAVSALRIAGAILLVAALTACRNGSGGSSGDVVEGGQLRVGLSGPAQLDPALANLASPADLMVLDLLHDGLTRLDARGRAVAAVAEGWSADPTFTTWTFRISPDATFASGRPITGDDVVASIEHVAKGGDASLAALRLERIVGFRAFGDGAAEHLEGLTAPTPASVRIVLEAPLSILPVILASPQYGIVDVVSLGVATSPGGDPTDVDLSGAWSVGSAARDSLRLDRRAESPGHLDRVVLRSYDSPDDAYDAVEAGDADWALVPVGRYGDAIEAYGTDAFRSFHAELFFGLRVSSPALSNGTMRRAIGLAIDRDAIVRAVYPDVAEPLARVVPDGIPGHDPDLCQDCEQRLDPAAARALLGSAFPDGQVPTVAIDFDESAAQEAMARIVAHDLEDVGIPTDLRPKPLEAYKAFVVSGAQELFSFGWIGGYASPDAYLAPLFGSTTSDNLTGYSSASVDAALAAARASADRGVQARRWAEVERQVLADGVLVPIAQFRTQAVVAERVRGLEHVIDGSVDWSAVWVMDGS
ncbi:MAG: ABC transporter substrate-binding protein [Acidimicrobiales bacterium]